MTITAIDTDGEFPFVCWADTLKKLPVIDEGKTANLHVERDNYRVWLARTGVADGEPFERTVYVDLYYNDRWVEFGYFDGDEPNPLPWGMMGDAFRISLEEAEKVEQ